MFFQQLSSLILITKLFVSLVSAEQLFSIDSLSDASSVPSADTSNSIFGSPTLSTEINPADSRPWLSSSLAGHDPEVLLSDNTAQKACSQSRKFRKSRRDDAGGGLGVCRPDGFKKDTAVTDKEIQDIMSVFDPKQWERVMTDSLNLKGHNGIFLPEDRRRCKYDPFLVHVCCNGPLGTRLLGVQALGEYYAFVDDCVSCRFPPSL